jgi:hypothetical protein
MSYLVAAALAGLVAALAVPWLATELAGHYYHPRLVALTHTVTLGWITLAIMGASYQLLPIVLERPVWSEPLAWIELALGVTGVIGMVAHFWIVEWRGLLWAAAVMAAAVAAHLVNVTLSLRGFTKWTFTARLVVVAYVGLALTTASGLVLAADRIWTFLPTPFFPTLHAHVHLALLGWVAPMIVGVAARVLPMFLLATAPAGRLAPVQLGGFAIGVPVLVLGLLGPSPLAVAGALSVAAALAGHVVWVIQVVRTRKRPALDRGLRLVLAGGAFLPPTVVLGLALAFDVVSGPRVALAYAVLALGGWVTLTIAGMMLKIVPFLVWYRVYSSRVGRVPVPTLAQLSWAAAERMCCVLLIAGALGLALAVGLGDPVAIRAAGIVLALGAGAFVAALGGVLWHLRTPAPGAAPVGATAR